jgi:acetyltransferase-like isoleucine patch superfamily enzyme/acyl carrier protein
MATGPLAPSLCRSECLIASSCSQILVFMDHLPKNSAGKLLRVRFSDRARLPSIDDDISPLERLYEGDCPPVGAPLDTLIQVKLVTIDLKLVEVFLHSVAGVETAAVTQLDLPFKRGAVVAFVTPATVDITLLQAKCEETFHAYLCPLLIHATDSLCDIPGLTGDERSHEALVARAVDLFTSKSVVLPQTVIEIELERIWREQLQLTRPLSISVSFFELGGDSLKAGALVSAVRKRFSVAITVADLFTSPTIASLAQQVTYLLELETDSPFDPANISDPINDPASPDQFSLENGDLEAGSSIGNWEYSMKLSNTSWGCLLIQLIPICVLFPLRRLSMWFLIAGPWVVLMNAGIDRFPALILAMIAMRVISATLFPLIAVLCKWLIIGEYKAGRYPLWGVMYLKWWLVEQIFRIAGQGIYREDFPVIGTLLVRLFYTLCGATVGKNVRISRNARLGQADLLAIGDDVFIDEATVSPFSLEEGHFVLLPIVIGDRCSVGAKSTVAAGSVLLSGTHLGPLSSSHEKDDANPNNLSYCRPAFPSPPWYLLLFYGLPVLIAVAMVSYAPWVIGLHLMVSNARASGWYDAEITTMYEAFLWWITPQRMGYYFALRVIQRCVVPYVRLLVVIVLKWSIIGAFRPLSSLERHRPFNLFRYWLMAKLLPGGDLGGVSHLVGTHYGIISIIYRALGAKVGKRVYWPGSGLDIVEYDLLEVGDDVVFGSRSVIMTSTSEHSNRIVLESGAMLADRCIMLPGSTLKQGCVLGSGSLATVDFVGPTGSMWVGNKAGCATMVSPEDLSYKTKSLVSPFGRAFYGNGANYCVTPLWLVVMYSTIWQGFCVCYHYCPILLSLFAAHFFTEFNSASLQQPFTLFRNSILAFVPVFVTLSLVALVFDVVSKWVVIGRRQSGDYSWDTSSYCQRWQFHLTLQVSQCISYLLSPLSLSPSPHLSQQIRRGEREHTGLLELICGSQYLVWYFRALGCRIGDNVCLYPNGGDPMMTEPDLVTIGANSCIDNASLIAHINTRGVFR